MILIYKFSWTSGYLGREMWEGIGEDYTFNAMR